MSVECRKCGSPISEKRAKNAIMRGKTPAYCSDAHASIAYASASRRRRREREEAEAAGQAPRLPLAV